DGQVLDIQDGAHVSSPAFSVFPAPTAASSISDLRLNERARPARPTPWPFSAPRTGVGSVGHTRRLAILVALRASRSRGGLSSSMPVLSSTSAVPRMATARPGGTDHHHAP